MYNTEQTPYRPTTLYDTVHRDRTDVVHQAPAAWTNHYVQLPLRTTLGNTVGHGPIRTLLSVVHQPLIGCTDMQTTLEYTLDQRQRTD